MVKALLVRGMIAGAIAGLLAFGVARILGEPSIEQAITFEELMQKTAQVSPHHGDATPAVEQPELVGRAIQAGAGLLTAVVIYGAGVGGLFAIVFAFAYGRIGQLGPRPTAALLAAGGLLSVVIVPFLKYPANPPAVGHSDTLGIRTALFLIMIAISIAALTLAVGLGRRLAAHFGGWNAALCAGALFVALIAIADLLLPEVNEVPEQFSAVVLWHFRMAALGMHVVMWAALGLVFGALAGSLLDRSVRSVPGPRQASL
jgi:hypothetical protein